MCDCQGHKPPLIITPAPDDPCCGGRLPLTEGQERALAAAALVCKDRPIAGRPSVSFTPSPPSPMPGPLPVPGARICKSIIPPWAGHHGGVSACFDGRGNLTSFVEHPERPSVADPF